MNYQSYYQQQKMAEQKVQQYYDEASQAREMKAAKVHSYADNMRNFTARMMRQMADWIAVDKPLAHDDKAPKAV
ncbi:MAG: hypothetical protein C4332_02055 [Meiothermus sp.]